MPAQPVVITKQQLQEEIEHLPETCLEQVYWFVTTIQPSRLHKEPIRTFHLQGQFDHLALRELAYE